MNPQAVKLLQKILIEVRKNQSTGENNFDICKRQENHMKLYVY